MLNSNMFCVELSKANQEKLKKEVREYLKKEGYSKEEIEESIINMMEDRLYVVSDLIDIDPYLMNGNVIQLDKR